MRILLVGKTPDQQRKLRKLRRVSMHGGKREGAGRRKGARSRASAMREQFIAQTGATPVDIMVNIMRCAFDMAQRELKQDEPNEAKVKWAFGLALESAHRAAPFAHPRFSAVDHSATLDASKLTQEEIDLVEPILRKAINGGPAGGTDENPPAAQR
jgi:hypothetical protein